MPVPQIPVPTAEDLRNARQVLKRSQTQMAKLMQVTFVTWHRWEKGLATPQPKYRGALAKIIALANARAVKLVSPLEGSNGQQN